MSELHPSADDFDDLDALLAARLGGDCDSLRTALRGRSTTAFVRRRRRRRAVRMMGMAACYLLGIATIYAWQQVSSSPASGGGETNIATPEETPPSGDAHRHAPAEPNEVAPQEPGTDRAIAAAERPSVPTAPIAKPAKRSRFDALRELGDRHLLADRNPEQALRCYRVALRYATTEEFTAASREGTWLLRAICLDTIQEKDHASKKS
jgi:hypothetical protein